ncbi:hypothetical protein ACJX0J_017170, partial [Zea mays]
RVGYVDFGFFPIELQHYLVHMKISDDYIRFCLTCMHFLHDYIDCRYCSWHTMDNDTRLYNMMIEAQNHSGWSQSSGKSILVIPKEDEVFVLALLEDFEGQTQFKRQMEEERIIGYLLDAAIMDICIHYDFSHVFDWKPNIQAQIELGKTVYVICASEFYFIATLYETITLSPMAL